MSDSEQKQPSFWQRSKDYHGVLLSSSAGRLAISPNGQRYLFQISLNDEDFTVVRWRKSLALLVPSLPAELAQKIEGLPDDPQRLARPWAEAMAAQSMRVKSAYRSSDFYVGVIATDGDLRVSILIDPLRYAVQKRDRAAWSMVAQSRERAKIERRCAGKPALVQAVQRLPQSAADYTGVVPELLGEAVRLPAPPRHVVNAPPAGAGRARPVGGL